MKSPNIIIAIALMAGFAVTVSGCLKDKLYDEGLTQSEHATGPQPKVVEVRLTASNNTEFLALTVDSANVDTTMNLVPINLATPGPATQDLHVTVSLDSTVVSALNNAYGTSFAVPPSSMYTIVNPVVTIAKGTHIGYVQIKLNEIQWTPASNFALGFRITNIQEAGYTISGNLSTGVVNITN